VSISYSTQPNERLGDLPGDRQRLGYRNRTTNNPVHERFPFDQFEDEPLNSVGVFKPVNRRDVWIQ
jgi:hypothetical protein